MARTYTTKSGDTLWEIAQQFYGDGARWHEIYEANREVLGDNPGTLFAGKTLTIPDLDQTGTPAPTPTSPQTYTTRPGDTLWSIAQHFYGDGNRWPEIYEANKAAIGADPRDLFAGKVLTIPPPGTGQDNYNNYNLYIVPKFRSAGGTITDSPAAIYFGMSRDFHVYVRSADGKLLQFFHNQWQDLGAPPAGFTESPGAVVRDMNVIDVCVRGSDMHIYHIYWDGRGWYSWETLGGDLDSGPALTSWSSGRLDCFARGRLNNLVHRWWTAGEGWSHWEDLSRLLPDARYDMQFAPAAVSWSLNRIDVFAVKVGDGHLIHCWWDGSWHGWEDLGGALTESPAAISRSPGLLDVFGRGTDGQVYHKFWDGYRWSTWYRLGGVIASAPAAAAGPQGIALFARGTDNTLQRMG